MLTILDHHNHTGVSARQLHKELQPSSGFVSWFRLYQKRYKEGQEVFLLSPTAKGENGRRVYGSGDYLVTLSTAQD